MQEEELRLALTKVPHELNEQRDIVLLLADHDGRRGAPARSRVRAVAGALDLRQPLWAPQQIAQICRASAGQLAARASTAQDKITAGIIV